MQIRTVRKPGERDTQGLVEKYGDRLVCIRYRYDPKQQRRYKTVELIIAEEARTPAHEPRIETPPPGRATLHPQSTGTHQVRRDGRSWLFEEPNDPLEGAEDSTDGSPLATSDDLMNTL